MSDNKTVPSAKTYFDEYEENDDIEIIMQKFARLHLEAMAKEIAENAELDCDEGSDDNGISVDKHSILKIATDYISKIA